MKFKISPKGIINATNKFIGAHAHEILAAAGISSFITAIIFAAKEAPSVQKDICKAEEKKGESLTTVETIKIGAKHYIPAAVTAVCGAACVIGATVLENRKLAAMLTLCQVTEDNLSSLKEHITESIGPKKTENLIEEVAAKKVADTNLSDEDIVKTKYGESVFYDPWSGRFFGSTKDRVERAVANINLRLTGCDFVYLNEFYDELDLANTNLGNYSGWSSRLGENLNMNWGYGPTRDGRSCAVLDYTIFAEGNIRKMSGVSEVLM